MVNPLRGEVELQTEAKTYVLRLSVNAVVEVEDLLGKSIGEVIASIERIGTLRALLWGALREFQPSVSIFDAGDLIGELGAEAVGAKIGEALKLAFPEPKAGDARPQTAATDGTGKAS
jgi:hypothetical protein